MIEPKGGGGGGWDFTIIDGLISSCDARVVVRSGLKIFIAIVTKKLQEHHTISVSERSKERKAMSVHTLLLDHSKSGISLL